MKPYYQDDYCTIYHGDCAEIIPFWPEKSFDLLMTDPPYGIGEAAGKNKSRGKLAPAKDFGNLSWDDTPPPVWLLNQAIWRCHYAVIWGGNYFALPPSSCWLVWDKDNGANDFADAELAWTNFKKAVRLKKYRWNGMLQQPGRPKEIRVHPTQKSLQVISWAISHAPKYQTILDPFMGSGTTLRAAKDLRVKATGIEKEERYCEIAATRLSQEVLPLEAA